MQLDVGVKGKNFWVAPNDLARARAWVAEGHTEALKTPDDTVVFVSPRGARDDPRGPGRLHGLPFALRIFGVEGP